MLKNNNNFEFFSIKAVKNIKYENKCIFHFTKNIFDMNIVFYTNVEKIITILASQSLTYTTWH